jgi:hypothetical protein
MSASQLTLRDRRRRRNRAGKTMFAGSLLLVSSIFVISYLNTPPIRNEDSLCLANESHKSLHIILVDKTDFFGPNFPQQIRSLIKDKIALTNMDERTEIFTIRGSHNKRFPADISLCNPGRGTDYNRLFYNQEKKQTFYRQHYVEPVEKIVDKISSSEQASSSPILEVLEDITTRPEMQEVKGEKTLTLISDMAQNSDRLRFVQDRSPVSVTEAQIRNGIKEIAGTKGLKFEGYRFEIYQIEQQYSQAVVDHVKETWEKIIRNSGGELAHWGDL